MKHLFVTALIFFFVAPPLQASAPSAVSVLAASDEHDDALRASKRGDILPYSQIKKRVEKQLGGRLVGERLRRTNQGWVYEVRVRRPDGRVIFAMVNAATGAIKLLPNKKNNN